MWAGDVRNRKEEINMGLDPFQEIAFVAQQERFQLDLEKNCLPILFGVWETLKKLVSKGMRFSKSDDI